MPIGDIFYNGRFWGRKGTCDSNVFLQTRDYKSVDIGPEDVVLDLGAHIGHYSMWASSKNASMVICVEPMPSNLDVLGLNMREADPLQVRSTIYPGAVVQDVPDSGVVQFYYNDDHEWPNVAGLHPDLLIVDSNRAVQDVRAISFTELLGTWNPTVIKCDIEGGEQDLDWSVLRDLRVRAVCMEHHVGDTKSQVKARRVHDTLTSIGFEPSLNWRSAFKIPEPSDPWKLTWVVVNYTRKV